MAETNPEVLASAQQFAASYIAPGAADWDRDGRLPADFFLKAAQAGLCDLLVPVANGGSGVNIKTFTQVLETLASECMAATFALVVHNNLAGSIAHNGSAAQHQQYLPAMKEGKRVGAFLLTEPGAGSDAASIATEAKKTAAGWVLNGDKAWISNADRADILCVYAKTPKAAGARGMAAFIVDANQAGVSRLPSYELLGASALGTGGFEFKDCEIDNNAVLLAPGDAFAAAMRGIDIARIGVTAMVSGMLARALAEAITYVSERQAFGRPLAEQQGLGWMLADAATDLEASRALLRQAVELLDAGEPATLACAHAKKFSTRIALTRIADCMQVMGANGLRREHPLARHLASAKVAQYLDGATEIQNVVIARQLRNTYT